MASSDQYRLVLTEEDYTTADGPMPRAEALAAFDQLAPGGSPNSGSRLRVLSETEYQRTQQTRRDGGASRG